MGSIVHLLIALKRKKGAHHVSTLSVPGIGRPSTNCSGLSLPMTGSRLIGSLTSFLEPMCLVLFAGVLLQQQLITTYGQLNGYVMPLLTLPSFATIALSNWLLPWFTYQASRHRMDHARKQFFQIGLCCSGTGCASGLTLFCFAEPICQLLYHQTQMVGLLRSLALPFILYSIQPCLSSVLHALGQSQKAMIDTTCGCLTRLACISFLTIPLGTQAVGIALVSGMLVTTVLHLGRVLRCLFQDEKAILLPQA
ncbi:MAG: polysaccharide biosynthesis C-terminal domain-containing protein [Holdemania filiformis]